MTDLAPACAQQYGEQDGPEDPELQPEILDQPQGMNEWGLPADVGAGMLDGGEAVLGFPDHVGDEQGKGQEHDHDQAAASQRLARLAGHGGMAGHAEESVDHRLFGEEAEADRYSEQDGKAHALPLHQHHQA